MDAAERVAMALRGGECFCNGEASSLPMGEEGESGGWYRQIGVHEWWWWWGGYLISQIQYIHTLTRNKTLEAAMDLSKYPHSQGCTHTFHCVELNISASRDVAAELFIAARL